MHNNLPKAFVYLSHYSSDVFANNNINLGVIYRNYNEMNRSIELMKIAIACKRKKYQLFVSNDIKLALKYKANGIYIPSFNKETKHLSFSMRKKFLILGSAHNNREIKLKERQLVKIIFVSSIFKKNKKYLGVNKFKLLSRLTNNKIIALGGISNKNLKKLKLLNCFGFAGISFFE